MTSPSAMRHLWTLLVALILLPLGLAGCDPVAPGADVTVQGAVTTNEGYDTDDGRAASVEGAVVTAAAVGINGQLLSLNGEATTNAEGQYTLTSESTAQAVRLRAEADAFSGSVMIEAGAAAGVTAGTIQAPPMTLESTAEADVYVASRTEASALTVADVSAHVSARAAASLTAGDLTAGQAASTIRIAVASERAYARHASGGGATSAQADEARSERTAAYAQFRTDITAATTLQQRRAAVETFLRAFARAYVQAGVAESRSAEAALTGAGAAQQFAVGANAQARFAAAQRARVIAAMATALAVEEEFRAAGAAEARLNTLAQARATLITALRAAANASATNAAWADYHSSVRTELAAELNVSPSAIDASFAATAAARATLETALAAAADAQAVAAAYVAFFAAARQAIEAELGAGASLGVNVIAMIAAF